MSESKAYDARQDQNQQVQESDHVVDLENVLKIIDEQFSKIDQLTNVEIQAKSTLRQELLNSRYQILCELFKQKYSSVIDRSKDRR